MMQHLQPNTTLQGGKFIIDRVLGQGGFGITYLAMQTSLQRKVAIKEFFMKDYCSRDNDSRTMTAPSLNRGGFVEMYRKKFIKEARNLARLNHPNIIKIIEVFEENGTVYYSMPYLSGGSLQDYVKLHGSLSETESMKYVKQIAKALKYMHEEQHICHYDVKPANILLDDNHNAVLIDFGISKNYDVKGKNTTTTPVGVSEGYSPVEQYQQDVEVFSPGSDVYALGATLYFLLHGKQPLSSIQRAGGKSLIVNKSISKSMKDILNASMKIEKTDRANSVDVFLNKKSFSIESLFIFALVGVGSGLAIWGEYYGLNTFGDYIISGFVGGAFLGVLCFYLSKNNLGLDSFFLALCPGLVIGFVLLLLLSQLGLDLSLNFIVFIIVSALVFSFVVAVINPEKRWPKIFGGYQNKFSDALLPPSPSEYYKYITIYILLCVFWVTILFFVYNYKYVFKSNINNIFHKQEEITELPSVEMKDTVPTSFTDICLKGTINNKINFTMFLSSQDGKVEGIEYYNSQPITIKGNISKEGKMSLAEYVNSKKTGTFEGVYHPNTYTGIFKNKKGEQFEFSSKMSRATRIIH